MKVLFFAASALVAGSLTAFAADLSLKAPGPSPVQQLQTSGYLELSTGGSWLDNVIAPSAALPTTGSTSRYNGWPIGGAGRANLWATRNFAIQLDAQAEGTRYNVPAEVILDPTLTSKFSASSYLIGGHANWRDPQTGLLGVFAGVGDAIGNRDTEGSFGNSGVRHALGGAEGQFYWNALTLYGQVGYDSTLDLGNAANVSGVNAWFARGTARYFFMPNLMMEATGQYSKGAMQFTPGPGFNTPDTGFEMWKAVAKAEWRPDAMPFSIFGKYEYNESRYDENSVVRKAGERVSENRVTAGVRLYFGPNSLLANDRSGATLDILDPLGSSTSPLMFGQNQNFPIFSDVRLKRDIHIVGRLDNGLGLYRYRYLWSDTEYVGVMAQEVALVQPKAVVHAPDGYLRVDYARLGIPFLTVKQWQSAISTGPL